MPRVLFPATGFTTDDAVAYYRAVAKYLLPYLRNVPLSFKRYPDTIEGESFWEKDAPSFTPKFVKTYAVPRRSGASEIRYVVVNGVKTLTWLASIGGIELHPFLHRIPHVERATSVVFDLDPGEGASIDECREVALLLRDALARRDATVREARRRGAGAEASEARGGEDGEAAPRALEFEPEAAIRRLQRKGICSSRPIRQAGAPVAPPGDEGTDVVVHGIRLPKARSQSGRRLFVMPQPDELWLRALLHRTHARGEMDAGEGQRLVEIPAGGVKP